SRADWRRPRATRCREIASWSPSHTVPRRAARRDSACSGKGTGLGLGGSECGSGCAYCAPRHFGDRAELPPNAIAVVRCPPMADRSFALTPGKRVLYLTKDPDRIRQQLAGTLTLKMSDLRPDELLDDINTDAMTPAWVCFDYDPA